MASSKVMAGITTLEEVFRNAKRTEQDDQISPRSSRFAGQLRGAYRRACDSDQPTEGFARYRRTSG